jgi:hypothetical protein
LLLFAANQQRKHPRVAAPIARRKIDGLDLAGSPTDLFRLFYQVEIRPPIASSKIR